ncbi:hypothetical protein, partial [Streptantibioticus silvisoli]
TAADRTQGWETAADRTAGPDTAADRTAERRNAAGPLTDRTADPSPAGTADHSTGPATATGTTAGTTTGASASAGDDGTHLGLVDGGRAAGIEQRAQQAAMGFIDGPRHAAEEMDALFEEVSALFTDGLAARRDQVRKLWSAGDGHAEDTEELRQAVQRYRQLVRGLIDA